MTIRNVPSGDMNARMTTSKLNKTDANTKTNSASFSEKFHKAVGSSKVDTIELSKTPVTPTLSQIRDSIVKDISGGKDADTIEKLRSRLESGEYNVDSGDLAQSILSSEEKKD